MSNLQSVVVTLSTGYALIGALLLSILVYARLPWPVKAVAVVLTSAFYVVSFVGTRGLMGWASDDRLPAAFKLLQARIVEPHSLEGDTGSIYLWVETLDDGNRPSGVPRAYRLPYTNDLAEKTDKAVGEIAAGRPQGGRAADFGTGEGSLLQAVREYITPSAIIDNSVRGIGRAGGRRDLPRRGRSRGAVGRRARGHGRRLPPAATRAIRSGRPGRVRANGPAPTTEREGDERHHPGRGRRHPAAPDHPGGVQAAAAGLRQADDLLPAVGADAGRHPGHPDHHHARTTTPQFRRLLGDGSEWGLHAHLRRAGRSRTGWPRRSSSAPTTSATTRVALVLGDNIFYGQGFSRTADASVAAAERRRLRAVRLPGARPGALRRRRGRRRRAG